MGSQAPLSIAELLEQNATRYEGSAALLTPGCLALSHAELWRSARAISKALIGLGAPAGTPVAVSLPEGAALARGLLGTACAHAAIPVGIDLPLREARDLLAPLAPAALVGAAEGPSALRELAQQEALPFLEIPAEADEGLEEPPAPPARGAGDPAFVLHTSGTTGHPKPVTLSHGNLLHASSWVRRSLGLEESDRCLNLMPLVHSHGLIGALISSLAAGGSVVCTERADPREMLSWASESECTWTTASPTLLRLLLDARGTWPGLRLLRSASAPMPPELARSLEERFRVPQIQVYGLTEAYQVAANPLPPGERRHGSVGHPTGCEVEILDDEGSPLATGEQGEIALSGSNVFEGYGAPGAAPDRSSFSGPRFRTGDLGFIDEGGYLHVTGRLGERINRGGEKIAPLAIEAALLEHPEVEEALCFPVPDDLLGDEIGALIKAGGGSTPDAAALRRFATTRLAPTRVPRFFWFRDELPRPASGKLNRRALAEELGLQSEIREAHDMAPGAAHRDALRKIWQEQLRLERAPRDDERFFDLGGTSLGLVELVITIERRFGVSLPLSAILEAPTLAELAELISKKPGSTEIEEICVKRAGFSVRLLPIQAQGEGPPLLFVGPAGGSVLGFFQLADRLPKTSPFWGLQIELQGHERNAPFGVPELGAAFVEGIERMALPSTLVLGGWSFGALVAWEIASQLRRRAEGVERLVALDTTVLRYGPNPPRESLRQRVSGLMQMIRESRPMVRDALYLRLARDPEGGGEQRRRGPLARLLLARLSRRANIARLIEKDPRLANLRAGSLSIAGTLRRYIRAAREYDPPRFGLAVDVLKAGPGAGTSATLGWEHLSQGEVRGHEVPGDHFTLLTPPHVEEVARVIGGLVSDTR